MCLIIFFKYFVYYYISKIYDSRNRKFLKNTQMNDKERIHYKVQNNFLINTR